MKRHPEGTRPEKEVSCGASRVSPWFVELVVRCLWFIGTWWEQCKRKKNKGGKL